MSLQVAGCNSRKRLARQKKNEKKNGYMQCPKEDSPQNTYMNIPIHTNYVILICKIIQNAQSVISPESSRSTCLSFTLSFLLGEADFFFSAPS